MWDAWQAERPRLAAVPLLPEPFDLAVTRTVAPDCTVAFEARRYSVPFARMGKTVIVSRLKAIRTYFSEAALAYFEPNSPQDLAKQMVGVYRDPALREQLAHRAKLEYAGIRWDIMRDRYLTLVERLVTGTRQRDPAASYRRDGRVA